MVIVSKRGATSVSQDRGYLGGRGETGKQKNVPARTGTKGQEVDILPSKRQKNGCRLRIVRIPEATRMSQQRAKGIL